VPKTRNRISKLDLKNVEVEEFYESYYVYLSEPENISSGCSGRAYVLVGGWRDTLYKLPKISVTVKSLMAKKEGMFT
jgi:hypothetical protein